MSTELAGLRKHVMHPLNIIGFAVRRWDAMAIFGVTGLAYTAIFLWALGNLGYQPGIGFGYTMVNEPLTRMFEPGPGRFVYEPIAILDLGVVRMLFSPFNTLIGLALGVLVGLNLALSYLAIVQPKACGIGTSSGLLASIPAVMAGGACCAPVILIVLGITAGGTMLTIITWLLPVGVVLLIGTLVYLSWKITPQQGAA